MSVEKIRATVGTPKPELLKIYKEHITELRNEIDTLKSTREVAQDKIVTEAVATASTIEIHSVEELLNQIINAKKEFENINLAIQAKKNELKDVLAIEVEANSLLALINAKSKFAEDQDKELEDARQKASDEAEQLIAAAAAKAAQIREEIVTEEKAATQNEARRSEEWEYNFKRMKKEKEDTLQDQLNIKTKSLDDRAELLKKQAEIIGTRVAEIDAQAAEIKAIKEGTTAAVAAAVEETRKKAETSAAISANIVKSKHDSEIILLNERNTSLTAQLAAANKEIDNLKAAVTAANKQVQDIAIKSLEARAEASRPMVVNGSDSSSKR